MVIERQITLGPEKGEELEKLLKKEKTSGLTPSEKKRLKELLELKERMKKATERIRAIEAERQKKKILEKQLPSQKEIEEAEKMSVEERLKKTREKLKKAYEKEFKQKPEQEK